MCRVYGTVCVLFRTRLVFPCINGLTVYLIFWCLSFPQPSLLFSCCIFRLRTNFPCFPISLVAGRWNKKWKGREKKEERGLVSVTRYTGLSIRQRPTDEKVAIGLFSLTKSKIWTLLQASIIDSESNSSSKLLTLIWKQTLLDTEPFLLVL